MVHARTDRLRALRQRLVEACDPCEASHLSDDVRGRVRAQQVIAISRMTPALMLVNIANALVLGVVLYVSAHLTPLAVAWVVVAVAVAAHALLRRRGIARPPPTTLRPEVSLRVVRSAALFGLVWTVPGVYFLPGTDGTAQAFVAALVTGMIGGGALALYPIPAAALVYVVLVNGAALVGLGATGDPILIGFTAIAIGFLLVVSRHILRHSELFVSEFVGRIELEAKNRVIQQLLEKTRLDAIEERRRSQQRLAQAQKMEAIGQLTGGIAHDFNNLLAAIQGHAELLELEGKADPSLVKPILRASFRGAELVRSLLSVARKQSLNPQPVDVGEMIAGMQDLLQRSLGAQVEIETSIDDGCWRVLADPGELESALLNLAINARDAMPEGGRLTVRCANAWPRSSLPLRRLGVDSGAFVELSVHDTGHGMTRQIRERAVEPFFTTKKFGQGSGLGLSTVYGFARQSGGHLAIESEPWKGTSVRLFLLRAPEAGAESPPDEPAGAVHEGAGQTVLVVEDDADVRTLVTEMLTGLGYVATAAADAAEALRVIETGREVDLVLTDVVLPGGTSGHALAGQLLSRVPDVPVAFMSGHTESHPRQGHVGEALLCKPFRRRTLAAHVHRALGGRPSAGLS